MPSDSKRRRRDALSPSERKDFTKEARIARRSIPARGYTREAKRSKRPSAEKRKECRLLIPADQERERKMGGSAWLSRAARRRIVPC